MPKKLNIQEALSRAIKIHGDVYDYCFVDWNERLSKAKIICKKHGAFFVTIKAHIRIQQPSGCPRCGKIKAAKPLLQIGLQSFLQKAIAFHGDNYDYSKVIWRGFKYKIDIICKKHGVFQQLPQNHIKKSGCPKCGGSVPEKIISEWLINKDINFIKEKTFDDCRNPETNHKLRFDFFIEKYNILIEYDGLHHFKDMPSSKAKDVKKRDSVKNSFAFSKNIKLYRLSRFEHLLSDLEKIFVDIQRS